MYIKYIKKISKAPMYKNIILLSILDVFNPQPVSYTQPAVDYNVVSRQF